MVSWHVWGVKIRHHRYVFVFGSLWISGNSSIRLATFLLFVWLGILYVYAGTLITRVQDPPLRSISRNRYRYWVSDQYREIAPIFSYWFRTRLRFRLSDRLSCQNMPEIHVECKSIISISRYAAQNQISIILEDPSLPSQNPLW